MATTFCVCQMTMDFLNTSTVFSNPKYTAKDIGTLGFEDSDVNSPPLLNRVFRVGVDQNLTVLGH